MLSIRLAKHIGFCSGVRRAINIAEKTPPCVILPSHDSLHNIFDVIKKKKLKYLLRKNPLVKEVYVFNTICREIYPV